MRAIRSLPVLLLLEKLSQPALKPRIEAGEPIQPAWREFLERIAWRGASYRSIRTSLRAISPSMSYLERTLSKRR